MDRNAPTDRDRAEAVSRLLSGLVQGETLAELAVAIEPLHPRRDTFPGEVFLGLCGDALNLAGVAGDKPLAYEELLDKHLADHRFRGRASRKIQFAILAGAAARGGIDANVLDEVVQWQSDDFWWYSLAAAVAVIRACAERIGQSTPTFAEQLAARTSTT